MADSGLIEFLDDPEKSGGDGLTKNATRAFAWAIAGIVGSIVVSIVMLIIGLVLGFSVGSDGVKGGSMQLVFLAALISIGVGFACAGAVYESFVGCP